MRPEFTLRLLQKLKDQGIHTAIDTCGHVSPDILLKSAVLADLFLFDIKTFSPGLHKKLTGMDNKKVLESLDIITRAGSRIYIRIPLVAGVNDFKDEIISIAGLLAKNSHAGNSSVALVELLAYHSLGSSKYASLGMIYQGNDFRAPASGYLSELAEVFTHRDIPVRIKLH